MEYVERHDFYQLFSVLLSESFEKRVSDPKKFIAQRLSRNPQENEKLKRELKALKDENSGLKVENSGLKSEIEKLKKQQKSPDQCMKIKVEKQEEDVDDDLVVTCRTLSIDGSAAPPPRKRFKSEFETSFEDDVSPGKPRAKKPKKHVSFAKSESSDTSIQSSGDESSSNESS